MRDDLRLGQPLALGDGDLGRTVSRGFTAIKEDIAATDDPGGDVGKHFGYRPGVDQITDHVTLLIESEDGGRAALVVDDIVDQRQVVIKGLDDNYGDVAGVAAATILGDGSIALILDTDELVERTKAASLSLGQVA